MTRISQTPRRSTALLVVLVASLAVTNARCTSSDRIIKCNKYSPIEMREQYFSNRSLTVLDLRNLHIDVLLPATFKYMDTITHIYLDGSRVDYVLNNTFHATKGLKLLSLRHMKSNIQIFLQSIEKGSIVGVDIGGNFATCSCAYWTTFLRISNSGTSVVNTNKLPFCSWEDINTCSGKVYTSKPKKHDMFEIDVAMPEYKPKPTTPVVDTDYDIMPIEEVLDSLGMSVIAPVKDQEPKGNLPLPLNDDISEELTEIEKIAKLSEPDAQLDDTRYNQLTDENFEKLTDETFDNRDSVIPDVNPFLRRTDPKEAMPRYSVDELPQTATDLKKRPPAEIARMTKPDKKTPKDQQPTPDGKSRDPLLLGMSIFGAIVGLLIVILCLMHLVYYINEMGDSQTSLISKTDIVRTMNQCQSSGGDMSSDNGPTVESVAPSAATSKTSHNTSHNTAAKGSRRKSRSRSVSHRTKSAPNPSLKPSDGGSSRPRSRSTRSENVNQHNATLEAIDLDMGIPRYSADGRYYKINSDVSMQWW